MINEQPKLPNRFILTLECTYLNRITLKNDFLILELLGVRDRNSYRL